MHCRPFPRPKKLSFRSTWRYTITQRALRSSTSRTCTWRMPSARYVPTKVYCRHASNLVQLSKISAMSSSYQRSICVWVVQPCAWQSMPRITSKTIFLSTTWSSRLPIACSSNPCRLVNKGTTTSSLLTTLNAWLSATKIHRSPAPSPTTPTQTRRRGSSWRRGSLRATSRDVVHTAYTCLSRTCSKRRKPRNVATQNQHTLTATYSTTFMISSRTTTTLSTFSRTTTRLGCSLVSCRRPWAHERWWKPHWHARA